MMRHFLAFILAFSLAGDAAAINVYGSGDAVDAGGLTQQGAVTPPASFTPAWQDLRMGAGGLLSSIYNYPDGTILTRTDTYGGYVYKPTGTCTYGTTQTFPAPCWQQLITATSLPSSLVNVVTSNSGNLGLVEITACASNTNVLYALFENTLLISVNRGVNWLATTQTVSINANSGPKDHGSFLACDPNNPDILYIGTDTALRKTINGTSSSGGASTATFATVATVGTTGAVPSIIAYDPASSVVGGVTQHFWVFTYSTGVYETTNGGGAFTLRNTTGMPTQYTHMMADKFSQLWVVDSSATIKKYVNGTGWTSNAVAGASGFNGIATDPNSASLGVNKVVAVQVGGQLSISVDNGANFSDPFFPETTAYTASGAQPGWLNVASQGAGGSPFTDTFNVVIDSASTLWESGGISVWTVPNPAVDASLTFSANAVGIEQLVTNQIIAPPGMPPLAAVWDRGIYTIKNPDVFPSIQYTNDTSINQIQGGWGIDWAAGTVGFVSANVSSNLDSSGRWAKSSDGGNTWVQWASLPTCAGPGGVIAVSTTTNWVVVPSDACVTSGNELWFTSNGSTSWTKSTVPGSPTFISFNAGVFSNRQPLCSDRVTANKFYAIDQNQTVYVSTNNGATFSVASTGQIAQGFIFRDAMVCVPGQAGNLFYYLGPQNTPHPDNVNLWKSTNGGVNWAAVAPGVLKEPIAVGFGAAKPGGSGYPVIYAQAWLSGVQCICQSNDGGATWAAISAPASQQIWAVNSVDEVTWITGDMNFYGRVYVGFLGSGAGYIDTANACPAVEFSNVIPNQALTGASVTLSAAHSGLVPVTGVQFSLDGVNIGAVQTGQTTYSVSFNASGQTVGAHTLKVQATGNGCTTTGNSFSIPITTSYLMMQDINPANDNDNTPMWLNAVG